MNQLSKFIIEPEANNICQVVISLCVVDNSFQLLLLLLTLFLSNARNGLMTFMFKTSTHSNPMWLWPVVTCKPKSRHDPSIQFTNCKLLKVHCTVRVWWAVL